MEIECRAEAIPYLPTRQEGQVDELRSRIRRYDTLGLKDAFAVDVASGIVGGQSSFSCSGTHDQGSFALRGDTRLVDTVSDKKARAGTNTLCHQGNPNLGARAIPLK